MAQTDVQNQIMCFFLKTLGLRRSYNASREEGDPLNQSRPYNLMVQTSALKEKTYPELVVLFFFFKEKVIGLVFFFLTSKGPKSQALEIRQTRPMCVLPAGES